MSAADVFVGAGAKLARTAAWDRLSVVHFICHGEGVPNYAPLAHIRLADDVLHHRPPMPDGSLVVLNGCSTAKKDLRNLDEGLGLSVAPAKANGASAPEVRKPAMRVTFSHSPGAESTTRSPIGARPWVRVMGSSKAAHLVGRVT